MRWVLREENPTWCFGLGGRSTSFGEVYGDMFDHHTVVYEFKSGPRLYALCQTRAGCYPNWDDIIMGTKGVCHWTACRIEGETNWHYEGPQNDADVAEQERLIGSIRSGKPINDGDTMIDSTYMADHGPAGLLHGQAGHLGPDAGRRLRVRAEAGRRAAGHGRPAQARRHRQLPAAQAGVHELLLN